MAPVIVYWVEVVNKCCYYFVYKSLKRHVKIQRILHSIIFKKVYIQPEHMVNTMTTIIPVDQKCSVCGYTSPQKVLGSTNSWGYPDLDFRPAPMQRDTMFTWLAECPQCGYVAGNLENGSEIRIDFVKSEGYLTCDGNEFISDVARRFYRRFMIEREIGNDYQCFLNLHRCAWSCDDNEDPLARDIRMLAMEYLDRIIDLDTNERDALLLIKADFLRRTSQFDKVIEEFKDTTFDDERYTQIIRFQILKASESDSDCYTGKDVFEE